jgi:hypothetical protein
MAAQLYANTQLAQALFEVLQELVEEGQVPEPLAVATLAQVCWSQAGNPDQDRQHSAAAAHGGCSDKAGLCQHSCRSLCTLQAV